MLLPWECEVLAIWAISGKKSLKVGFLSHVSSRQSEIRGAEWLGSMSTMEMELQGSIFIFKAGGSIHTNEAEAPMNTVFPRTDIRGMTEVGDETKTEMSLINILPLP